MTTTIESCLLLTHFSLSIQYWFTPLSLLSRDPFIRSETDTLYCRWWNSVWTFVQTETYMSKFSVGVKFKLWIYFSKKQTFHFMYCPFTTRFRFITIKTSFYQFFFFLHNVISVLDCGSLWHTVWMTYEGLTYTHRMGCTCSGQQQVNDKLYKGKHNYQAAYQSNHIVSKRREEKAVPSPTNNFLVSQCGAN